MSKIVAVSHDEKGTLESYKLDNGQIIDRDQAVDMANRGQDGYSLDELPEIGTKA